MSTFTLRGQRGGETIELTWTDGTLSGDPDSVEWVKMLAAGAEGHTIMSPADVTHRDHLQNPSSASMLMRMVFSRPPECIYSDLPPLPEPPEGAVM